MAYRLLTRRSRWTRTRSGADNHPAAGVFKRALVEDGIPYASFAVDDARAEYERLSAAGVRFTQEPLEMGDITTTVLDDTCGNLIQLASSR